MPPKSSQKKKKVQGPGNKAGVKAKESYDKTAALRGPMRSLEKPKEEVKPEKVDPLQNFKTFYKENNLVEELEWRNLLDHCVKPIPMSFRLVESFHLCPSHIDTIPGVPSRSQALLQYMKRKHVETLCKMTVNASTSVTLSLLTWYPKELGWCLNIPRSDADKYLGLKKFFDFINSQPTQCIETWSMLPSVLLDIQPHHCVLDMCAAPGFIASQIAQRMDSDPNQAANGVLILNDLYKAKDGLHLHWTQGIKAVSCNYDAKKFPDLYLSDKKSFSDQLQYDHVICDVKNSMDGIMRKNTGLQENWKSHTALHLHSDQKAIARRALELVKVRGYVLYSTTSMNPIENEAVVMAILEEAAGSVVLADCRPRLRGFKFRPGLTTWKVMSAEGLMLENYEQASIQFTETFPKSVFPPPIKEAMAYHMERCIRVLPHDNDTAGFFCAVFVKNTELSWIQEKAKEEKLKEEKEKEDAKEVTMPEKQPSKPVLKPYFPGRLLCQLSCDAIEWTTETTDQSLRTTVKTITKAFPRPPLTLDPNFIPPKPPQLLASFKDPLDFIGKNDEEWLKIKEFFKIMDSWDPTCLKFFGENELFQSTKTVKSLVQNNKQSFIKNFGKQFGVRFFYELPYVSFEVNSPCPYMMTNEALGLLYPFIGKQLVNIDCDDLLRLAYYETVKIASLSAQAQTDITDTDEGCILFIYKPKSTHSVPVCNIAFSGVRNAELCLMYSHQEREQKAVFCLAGMEREDYERRLTEEKLAKIMAKDAVAMDTS